MASDSVGSEFLCVWDEPYYGPRTLIVRAYDVRDVRARFPKAQVMPVEHQTIRSPEIVERMRYAVGPYQDPTAPVAGRSEAARAKFLAERDRYQESLRASRRAAGDDDPFIQQVLQRPLWVEIDDEDTIALAVRDWPEV